MELDEVSPNILLLVSYKCHDNHEQGGLSQQKFILSQFWSLEILIQGVSTTMLPLRF